MTNNVMQDMLERDAERMRHVQEAVDMATGYLEDAANGDELLLHYMKYKVGGNLMMSVLETFDKKLMTRELFAAGGGQPPTPPVMPTESL